VILLRIVAGFSIPPFDKCSVLRGENRCHPPARIRRLSPKQDARVTAPSPGVPRPGHDSTCLGVTDGLQTGCLNHRRRRRLITVTHHLAARLGAPTPTRGEQPFNASVVHHRSAQRHPWVLRSIRPKRATLRPSEHPHCRARRRLASACLHAYHNRSFFIHGASPPPGPFSGTGGDHQGGAGPFAVSRKDAVERP
jgi:hypothetical protein